MAKNIRLTRNELFIETAKITSRRSSCPKKQVGAVLVLDNRIIAQGYNGVLPSTNPSEGLLEDGTTKTVHAEANIIAFCAKHGIATNNTKMFVTLSPCEKCAELIIQSGIKEVIYIEDYRDSSGLDKLRKHKIKVIKWNQDTI